MPHDPLDRMLASAVAPLPESLDDEARRLARATAATARRSRPRWLLPLAISGVLALTAGAGTATVAMSHWAGVSMPLENARSLEPIRISWVTDDGHEERCRYWIELRNPEQGDRERLDAAIRGRDWDGLGQQLYDQGPVAGEDPDGESRVSDRMSPVLMAFAAEVFPGIRWGGDVPESDARAVDSTGMTCVPEGL